MDKRDSLREFYYSKNLCGARRAKELETVQAKDQIAAKERKFLSSKNSNLVMAIGNMGNGVGSSIKGYDRRGGKWLENTHGRHATTITTNEYMSSQLCVYCYRRLHHPVLGTSRCLNPQCVSFKEDGALQTETRCRQLGLDYQP